jgi:hypothetical protein
MVVKAWLKYPANFTSLSGSPFAARWERQTGRFPRRNVKSQHRWSTDGRLFCTVTVSNYVKFSLCLTKYHTMKTYPVLNEDLWGCGGIAPRILNLSTRWKWVVSFTPSQLYSLGKSAGTHWKGGSVGPWACLDAVRKKKIATPGIQTWSSP